MTIADGPQHLWCDMGAGTHGCACGVKIPTAAMAKPTQQHPLGCTHIWIDHSTTVGAFECILCGSHFCTTPAAQLHNGLHCFHTWTIASVDSDTTVFKCTWCSSTIKCPHKPVIFSIEESVYNFHYTNNTSTEDKGNLPQNPVAISSPEISHPWPDTKARLDLLEAAKKNGHKMERLDYDSATHYWVIWCTHCHSCYFESKTGYSAVHGWDKHYEAEGHINNISDELGIDLWWEPNDLNLSTFKCQAVQFAHS